MLVQLLRGDCLDRMAAMPEGSLGAIVCDPPYFIEFMGHEWDSVGRTRPYTPRSEAGYGDKGILPGYGRGGTPEDRLAFKKRANLLAQQFHEGWLGVAYRVLAPGGIVKAMSGTRTFHRLAMAMERAGFEGIDVDAWTYSSGFPKSMDLSQAIDKMRDDTEETLEVTRWINAAIRESGVKAKELAAPFGFTVGMPRHWSAVTVRGQPEVPTLEQWPVILDVLGIDPEDVPDDITRLVIELNEAKGRPGEAWFRRELISSSKASGFGWFHTATSSEIRVTASATEEARTWEGWGTALKPSWEPVLVGRKP
jgi:hypothetical protein